MILDRMKDDSNFILAIDGPDACGKSTVCRLFDTFLEDKGFNVATFRMPGSTLLGSAVREIFKSSQFSPGPTTERLLLAADFSQWYHEMFVSQSIMGKIENTVIVTDRWFPITDEFYQKKEDHESNAFFKELLASTNFPIPELDAYIILQCPWEVLKYRMETDPIRQYAGTDTAQGYRDKHRCRIEDRPDLEEIAAKYRNDRTRDQFKADVPPKEICENIWSAYGEKIEKTVKKKVLTK